MSAKEQSGQHKPPSTVGKGDRSLHAGLEEIAIIPAQLYGSPPRDPYREPIKTDLVLGEGTAENPIKLETPILIAGVPGAYASLELREALLYGAGSAKTAVDCGWFGLTDAERALAAELGARTMVQLTSSRLGASAAVLADSSAIILSLTHTGSGSINASVSSVCIPETLAPELYEALELPTERPVIGPPRLLDMDTPRDLNKLVQLMRELTMHKIPVLVKIGPGLVYNDIRIAVKAEVDGIVLDCMQDSGYATSYHKNIIPVPFGSTGLPMLGVLAPALQALKDSKAKKSGVKLLVQGELQSGADIFKVMAFGASGVILASAPLRAAGAISEGSGSIKIPSKFKPRDAGKLIAEHLESTLMELRALTAWTGHDSIEEINPDNLRALCFNTAAITGLKLTGYEKILTMWEH